MKKFTEKEKIAKGEEIKKQVEKLWYKRFDYRNYSINELEVFQKQIKELWSQCLGHNYQWFSHDSWGGGDCHCTYCGAEHPRTANF